MCDACPKPDAWMEMNSALAMRTLFFEVPCCVFSQGVLAFWRVNIFPESSLHTHAMVIKWCLLPSLCCCSCTCLWWKVSTPSAGRGCGTVVLHTCRCHHGKGTGPAASPLLQQGCQAPTIAPQSQQNAMAAAAFSTHPKNRRVFFLTRDQDNVLH